jgi:hypothetical protein
MRRCFVCGETTRCQHRELELLGPKTRAWLIRNESTLVPHPGAMKPDEIEKLISNGFKNLPQRKPPKRKRRRSILWKRMA